MLRGIEADASGKFADCGYSAESRLTLGKGWVRIKDNEEEAAWDVLSVGEVRFILLGVVWELW